MKKTIILCTFILIFSDSISAQKEKIQNLKNKAIANLQNYNSFVIEGNLYSRTIGENDTLIIPFIMVNTEGDSFLFQRHYTQSDKKYTVFQFSDSIPIYTVDYKNSNFTYLNLPKNPFENTVGKKSNKVKRILGNFLDSSYNEMYILSPNDTIIQGILCQEFGIKPHSNIFTNSLRYSYFVSIVDSIHRGFYAVDVVEKLDTMITGAFIHRISFNQKESSITFKRVQDDIKFAEKKFPQFPLETFIKDTNLFVGEINSINVFDLNKGDSTTINFEKGKFLLDFWYVGCLPCLKSIPYITRLEEEFQKTKINFIKFNPIDGKYKLENLKAYNKKRKIEVNNYTIEKSYTNFFGVDSYPSFILIEDGKIIKKFEGFDETVYEELKKYLEIWTADSR